ncbi:hypothetical protein [Gilliamella sp. wkB171]|uniref:hypothetical protein n=1 Tax=Gilliamella sp. wkB171 TaxID=3120258 RepID=UPI0008139038|nr:hypothetical protein [Gilliamella apicola]OCL24924.1 hypothetical protein A9G03_03480 [Gilliamella apicola]
MKKLLLVACCLISFYVFASVDDNSKNIGISNNYLILLFPENTPHSNPIKKQELFIENIQPTSFTSNIEIYSDDNGFIIEEFFRHKKDLSMDYQKQVLTRNEKGILVNYLVQLDDQKNFINVKNSNQKTIATYEYDEQGKLIFSDEKFDEKNYIGTYSYDINNNLIQYKEREIQTNTPEKILTFPSTNLYYYDDENRLVSSNFEQEDPLLNGEIILLSKDIYESKYRTSTCHFSEYNKYGDWTVSQCFNGDNELDKSVTRKLEYRDK